MSTSSEARTAVDSCTLCGSTDARQRFREEPFAVLDCQSCGLTFVSPCLDPESLVSEVYDADYWHSSRPRERGYGDYRRDRDLYLRTFKRRWNVIRKHFSSPGRVLDVGCASGDFLHVLEAEGWEVLGLEPSSPIAETARARIGADRVIESSLTDVQLDPESLDLITLWDVLEHLPDPVESLRKAHGLLAPGGKLVLETQDVRSLLARLMGRRWHHFKHQEHLVHFHPGTLRRALEEAGFDLIELRRRGAGKYVRGDFVVERSARLHPRLPGLLRPFLGGQWSTYVNLGDELIAIAAVKP